MLNIPRINTADPQARQQIAALRARLDGDVVSEAGRKKTLEAFGEALSPVQVVERICRDVRKGGLTAVLDYTAKLDGKKLSADELRVTQAELAAAHKAADPEFLDTIRRIRARILRFQQAILHRDVTIPLEHGCYLARRYLPLRRVGVCVPGGAAAYPSTVLMTVVPAQAAGVEEIAIVAPPTPFGCVQPGPARHMPRAGRHRGLSHRRGPGRRGAGVRRRGPGRASTRSSAQAICSSRWRKSTCSATWGSTPSPGPAK